MTLFDLLPPLLSALGILFVGTVLGALPTRRIVQMREAHHELRQGSAGFLRRTAGWISVLLWIASLWFAGTIIGDWVRLDDLDLALERSGTRLRVILEILAALGSD